MMNPILAHSKIVWQEVHNKCKLSHNKSKYASIWYNSNIKIGKQTIYWAQWLRKGIRILNDLFNEGDFLSYNRMRENSIWREMAIFGNIKKLRHCIKGKVHFHQEKGTTYNYQQYLY